MANGRLVESSRAIDAIGGALKGKRRIVEVAAATLCKLNAVMKRMKDWRDDRATLRSDVRRLKSALRAVEAEASRAGPLQGRPRGVVRARLKDALASTKEGPDSGSTVTEDDLWESWRLHEEDSREKKGPFAGARRNSVEILRGVPGGTKPGLCEEPVDQLRRRLGEFSEGDRLLETILADLVSRVADVIVNLSEELVDASEGLHRSRARNEGLYWEIDKLRSMLRLRCGDNRDYRERIQELESIARRLEREGRSLLFDREDETGNSMRLEAFGRTEKLMGDLRDMLKHDHAASLIAGDPERLKYMTRMIELRFTVQHILVELDGIKRPSNEFLVNQHLNRTNKISLLKNTLKHIDAEVEKLRSGRMLEGCAMEGIEGTKYLEKLEELVAIVEEACATINRLKNVGEKIEEDEGDKLMTLLEDLCRGIEELENIVAARDPSDSSDRTEELERKIVGLKDKLIEKEGCIEALEDKLTSTRRMLEERVKELKDTRRVVVDLTEEGQRLKEEAERRAARISELSHERRGLTRRLAEEMQQVRSEAAVIRGQLEDLRADKGDLLEEMERMREAFSKENEEIAGIMAEKDASAEATRQELEELRSKLRVACEENAKLEGQIQELKKLDDLTNSECGDARYSRGTKELIESNIKIPKVESRHRRNDLDTANRTIVARLKTKLRQMTSEKSKLEAKVLHLDSTRETLAYELGVAMSRTEERSKELSKALSSHGALEKELQSARRERERLIGELSEANDENGSLRASMADLEVERSDLQSRVEGLERERDSLHRELIESRTNSVELTSRVERARTELAVAMERIKELEVERDRRRELEVATSGKGELEKTTDDEKDLEVTKDQTEDLEIAEDQTRDLELAKNRIKELEVTTDQIKELEISMNQIKDLKITTNQINKINKLEISMDPKRDLELARNRPKNLDLPAQNIDLDLSTDQRGDLELARNRIEGLSLTAQKRDLDSATDRIKELEAAKARLEQDLAVVTLKNTEGEARARVLLAERNDLATRINEVNEENVALRDQVNKVKGENEYFSVELNKSRIENDGAKSKNATLRDMHGAARREGLALRRANEELTSKLRECRSERRISDNRAKLLRMRNATLERTVSGLCQENEDLKKRLKTLRGPKSCRPKADARSRNEEGEERVKLASDGREVDGDDEARTRRRPKDTVRKLRAENEALKFDLANLRVEKSEVGLELSRTKEKFERLRLELAEAEREGGAIEPIVNKLELVNLYYRREINNREEEGALVENAVRLRGEEDKVIMEEELLVVPKARSTMRENLGRAREIEKLALIIDELSIENIALKLEAQTLRSSIARESTRDKVARNELARAKEEILALKSELVTLREEKECLRSKLDGVKAELDGLRSERAALKGELVALREVNDNLRCRANELQNDYQKLAEVNTGLELNLISVLDEASGTVDGSNLGQFEERLRNVLYQYMSLKNSKCKIKEHVVD